MPNGAKDILEYVIVYLHWAIIKHEVHKLPLCVHIQWILIKSEPRDKILLKVNNNKKLQYHPPKIKATEGHCHCKLTVSSKW